jgi:hypothetical protein
VHTLKDEELAASRLMRTDPMLDEGGSCLSFTKLRAMQLKEPI